MKKIFFLLALLFMASVSYVSAQNFVLKSPQPIFSGETLKVPHAQTRANYVLQYYNPDFTTWGAIGYNGLTGTYYASACISFTAAQMNNYVGGSLQQISFYLPAATSLPTLVAANCTVWVKGETNGAIVYQQNFTPTAGAWNDIVLTTPQTLAAGPLTFGYTLRFNASSSNISPFQITAAGDAYQLTARDSLLRQCGVGYYPMLYRQRGRLCGVTVDKMHTGGVILNKFADSSGIFFQQRFPDNDAAHSKLAAVSGV